MSFGPRLGLGLVLAAELTACAVVAPAVSKLPDGSYRITCKDTLSTCLGAFENICDWHGYDVISASEQKRRADLRDVPDVTVTSEAQVRCKPGELLFGNSPAPAALPAPTPAPAAEPPRPTAPAAEPPHLMAPAMCVAPQADGGANPCSGASPGTPPAPPSPEMTH